MILVNEQGASESCKWDWPPSDTHMADRGYTIAIMSDAEISEIENLRDIKDLKDPEYNWVKYRLGAIDRINRHCKMVTLKEYIDEHRRV